MSRGQEASRWDEMQVVSAPHPNDATPSQRRSSRLIAVWIGCDVLVQEDHRHASVHVGWGGVLFGY